MRSALAGLGIAFLLEMSAAQTLPDEKTSTAVHTSLPPFSVGERLVYQIDWNPPWWLFFLPTMEAGEVELGIEKETSYLERRALKIVFKARSSGTLAKLSGVTVADHFEFFTDPETLCTIGVFKRIREGKRKRDIEIVYYPDQKRLHILEVDVSVTPGKVKRDDYVEDIPSCVKDLFSALYTVRRGEVGAGVRHRAIVGDNARVKEIAATVEGSETVQTPLGKFLTWKVNTVALLGGLFKDGGQFRLWLSADEKKIPVQFEAKVGLGKVTGRLKLVEPAKSE